MFLIQFCSSESHWFKERISNVWTFKRRSWTLQHPTNTLCLWLFHLLQMPCKSTHHICTVVKMGVISIYIKSCLFYFTKSTYKCAFITYIYVNYYLELYSTSEKQRTSRELFDKVLCIWFSNCPFKICFINMDIKKKTCWRRCAVHLQIQDFFIEDISLQMEEAAHAIHLEVRRKLCINWCQVFLSHYDKM